MSWVNLAEGVNLDYLKKHAEPGKTFGFNQEGHIQHYRVMRVNKKSGKYWAKRVDLLTVEEAEAKFNGERSSEQTT